MSEPAALLPTETAPARHELRTVARYSALVTALGFAGRVPAIGRDAVLEELSLLWRFVRRR